MNDLYNLLLVALLGHPSFMVRQNVERYLTQQGFHPALFAGFYGHDAERAARCERILERQQCTSWHLFMARCNTAVWIDALPIGYPDRDDVIARYRRLAPFHPNGPPTYPQDLEAGTLFIADVYAQQGSIAAEELVRKMRERMKTWDGGKYNDPEQLPAPGP